MPIADRTRLYFNSDLNQYLDSAHQRKVHPLLHHRHHPHHYWRCTHLLLLHRLSCSCLLLSSVLVRSKIPGWWGTAFTLWWLICCSLYLTPLVHCLGGWCLLCWWTENHVKTRSISYLQMKTKESGIIAPPTHTALNIIVEKWLKTWLVVNFYFTF